MKTLPKLFSKNKKGTVTDVSTAGNEELGICADIDFFSYPSFRTGFLEQMKINKKICLLRKPCTKCRKTKPLNSFNRNRHTFDGHQPHCRDCQKTIAKQNYEKGTRYPSQLKNHLAPEEKKRRRLERAAKRISKCRGCGRGKPCADWAKTKHGKEGYRRGKYCNECSAKNKTSMGPEAKKERRRERKAEEIKFLENNYIKNLLTTRNSRKYSNIGLIAVEKKRQQIASIREKRGKVNESAIH